MSDTPRSDYARVARDLVRGAPVDYVAYAFAQELERELAAMTARYRWIIDNKDANSPEIQAMWRHCTSPYPSHREWDAAIDAAMKQQSPAVTSEADRG